MQAAYNLIKKGKCPNCKTELNDSMEAGDKEIYTCGSCASNWVVDHNAKTVEKH
ncbi:hypothetical protein [Vibrio phage vB_pir03]|nr:hypothetical protein [Vibrio phage vB_pir03]